jgi:carbon monoxide dehydrogenase subunit G
MILGGTYKIPAAAETVWQGLMNPEVLAHALPGCEKLEASPDGSYHAQMKVGIAAVKGTYQGRIEILDPIPNELFRIKVDGQGTGGFLNAIGTLSLASEAEGTLVRYAGEAQVGGVIASVGQRLMLAAAKQIINQFFKAFAQQLAAGGETTGNAAGPPAAGTPPQES